MEGQIRLDEEEEEVEAKGIKVGEMMYAVERVTCRKEWH